MVKVAKTYRLKQDSIEMLEEIRAAFEKELGMKVSATAAIEMIVNRTYKEMKK